MNRATIPLNGIWNFRFFEGTFLEEIDENTVAFDSFASVPGNFDILPETLCKRGCGVYSRTFTLEHEICAILKVDGISLRGRFKIDGREIGVTPLPYSGVTFETGRLAAGTHTLTAVIDNYFSPEKMKLFLPFYDFYAFGGFHRGIELVTLPEGPALDRVQVRTADYRNGKVTLRAIFRTGSAPLEIRFDTESAFHAIENGAEVAVPGFKLWSPESPNLHFVEVKAGSDRITETFGIREVKVGPDGLRLNGKPVYLKGFNRHESHPAAGSATTESMMLNDLQNLKALNCNFVRGCHYPQSQTFLDLCDKMGFLVWEESLGWGNTRTQLADPEFMALQEEQTRLMVRNSINHPSVVIWGFLNEFDSASQEGRTLCQQLMAAIREEDSSRPGTFASNHATTDLCFDLVDLIAFNTYPGWIQEEYREDPPEAIGPNLDEILGYCRKFNKPVMVSEMGTCALYGEHDPAGAQWTEEFQAQYLDEVIRQVKKRPLCGITIWQMNDAKSYHRKGANIRCKPLALNLAGVFDPYRRPKLAAQTVKQLFEDL